MNPLLLSELEGKERRLNVMRAVYKTLNSRKILVPKEALMALAEKITTHDRRYYKIELVVNTVKACQALVLETLFNDEGCDYHLLIYRETAHVAYGDTVILGETDNSSESYSRPDFDINNAFILIKEREYGSGSEKEGKIDYEIIIYSPSTVVDVEQYNKKYQNKLEKLCTL
jgi:hypothetical protein